MELAVVHEVSCRAGLDSTWDFVAEQYFDHHSSWDPAVVAMQQNQPGPPQPGLTGVETRRSSGDSVPASRLPRSCRSVGSRCGTPLVRSSLDRAYDFAPESAGTRIRFSFHMAPKGPARLLFPLLRPVIARQVRSNIDRLADVVS